MDRKIIIDNELIELSELINNSNEKIYIVGGYIRKFFLGVKDYFLSEVDLCSTVKMEDLKKILKNTKFKINELNTKLNVFKICVKDKTYECATFRKEKYDLTGNHYPISVEFVKDINIDVQRRDFTCNAIYYDIFNDVFIDLVGGINDIKNKILNTVLDSYISFSQDSERIIRMVRLMNLYKFKINNELLNNAKLLIKNIDKLSKHRLKREIDKIFDKRIKMNSDCEKVIKLLNLNKKIQN